MDYLVVVKNEAQIFVADVLYFVVIMKKTERHVFTCVQYYETEIHDFSLDLRGYFDNQFFVSPTTPKGKKLVPLSVILHKCNIYKQKYGENSEFERFIWFY